MSIFSKRRIAGLALGLGMTAGVGLGIGTLGTANAVEKGGCVQTGANSGLCGIVGTHGAGVVGYNPTWVTGGGVLLVDCSANAGGAYIGHHGQTLVDAQSGVPCPHQG